MANGCKRQRWALASGTHRRLRAGAWFICLGVLTSCISCATDEMETSPAWKPQEMEVVLPAYSVPVTGREEVIQDVASLAAIVNPIAPSATSVEAGQVLFAHHCSACHGEAGQGGAPMAEYYGEPPSLLGDRGLNLTDGFIYNTIREGLGLMPPLGEALSTEERWHIVNYLRRLQRQ